MNKELEKAIYRLKFHKECAGLENGTCVVNVEDIEILLNYINKNKLNKNTCTYIQTDTDYNAWCCNKCHCEWCFEEGNPKDNNTNYCPECGARIKNFIEFNEKDEDF